MKNLLKLFLAVLTVFTIQACSSDFDVIGDYQETTIVYGLLDQSESLHLIKINKSFLGPGNAFTYAQVRDSSEYENVDGKIEEWINGVMTRQWTLNDTVLHDREDGVFYGPDYTAYYFVEPNLDPDAEYRLNVVVGENKEVKSYTYLIGSLNFNYPPNTNPVSTIGFAVYNSTTQTTTYNDYPVKWIPGQYGKRFDLSIRFKWDEVTATDTVRKYIDWFVGSEVVDDDHVINGPHLEIAKSANGESFYNNIANKLSVDPGVLKRIARGVDIMVSAASVDLYTYMIVNEPSTGIIQERPQYTNIDNGVGIFSARYNAAIRNKFLNKNSLDELCNGTITGHLGFCSDTIIYSAESFYCQ